MGGCCLLLDAGSLMLVLDAGFWMLWFLIPGFLHHFLNTDQRKAWIRIFSDLYSSMPFIVCCLSYVLLLLNTTTGAAVGASWGRTRHVLPGTSKSVEGSLAMLVSMWGVGFLLFYSSTLEFTLEFTLEVTLEQ